MTKRYEPVLTWCSWLLAMNTPALAVGAQHSPGLLFDMNRLFEAYVGRLQEETAGESRLVKRQGPIEPLATQNNEGAFFLKPDITIWRTTSDGAPSTIERIVDAKWKRLDPNARQWGIDEADIYQLVAYAVHYGCCELELIYPMPKQSDGKEVQLPTFEIPLNASSASESITIAINMVPLW